MAYSLVIGPTTTPYLTLAAAVGAMLDACAADPEVTTMPYVAHADGSRLTDAENDAVDRMMAAVGAMLDACAADRMMGE